MIEEKFSITFLYPSRRVGGAQLLFIRLAKELFKYKELSVNVVDYPGGYLETQLLTYPDIKILPYKNGSVEIKEKTTIVTPLSNFADLKYLIRGNFEEIKILLWSIHPSNIEFVFKANGRRWFVNKNRLKDLFRSLSDNGNIVYMDQANFLAVKKEIGLTKAPSYLPIPLDIKEKDAKLKRASNFGQINIAWLGRISYDKIYSIIKIVDEIAATIFKNSIVFHIIGDGEKMDQLKAYLNTLDVKYKLPGVLTDQDLTSYMNENVDLGVAMGTSCMEFAVRNIPVFLIDFSTERFPESIKYNWLFETMNYTLGSHVDFATCRKHTFTELLKEFNSNPALGKQCYRYVEDNHNIKNIALDLLKQCKQIIPIMKSDFNNSERVLNPFIYRYFYSLYRKFRGF